MTKFEKLETETDRESAHLGYSTHPDIERDMNHLWNLIKKIEQI